MRDTGYRILADGVTTSNDTWATGLANHDLIIGPQAAARPGATSCPTCCPRKNRLLSRTARAPCGGSGRHP